MILFVFAHRLEAQSFYQHFKFMADHTFTDILSISEDKKLAIAICGEGHFKALETTHAVIAYLKHVKNINLKAIYNIGIAGSLDPKISLNSIVEISYSLLVHENFSPEFHTYKTESFHKKNPLNLVTFTSRVKDLKTKSELFKFGHVVDREFWGVARASAFYNIPIFAFKMISDEADAELCPDIKAQAEFFSSELFKFTMNALCIYETKKPSIRLLTILENEAFHFTQTQKHQVKKLFHALKIQTSEDEKKLVSDAEIQEIIKTDLHPKKRSMLFIAVLQNRLNPFLAKWKNDFKDINKPLITADIDLFIDPKLEDTKVDIHFSAKNADDYHKKLLALENFNFNRFTSLVEGLD